MYLCAISSRLLLYDINSWDLKKSYSCYDGILRDISWSDDSKYMLQVNAKGLVEILSPADHDVRSLQHIPLKDTWSACFHRDGHRNIAIGTKSGNVLIWDTKNKTIIKTFPTPSQQSSVNFVSYNAKNTSLAATMLNGDTVIYGLVSNIPVLTIKLCCSKSISAMKFHHESRPLVGLATDEGHVVLRDITANKDKAFYENVHASPVSDIAYSLINKDVMLSSGYDKIVNVYDVRLQTVVSPIRTAFPLTSVAINTENQVSLGTKTGTILIYDLRDFKNALKVLKCHDEEVRRVAYQPVRKKLYSAEVSLREESETMPVTPIKEQFSVQNRTSDMFFMDQDTPPRENIEVPNLNESNADSFLVMVGLDKSNNVLEDERNVSSLVKKSEKYEFRYNQNSSEKDVCKISTPLNSKTVENPGFQPSPLCPMNGMPDDGRPSSSNKILSVKHLHNSSPAGSSMDGKVVEELKDFIKLTLADVADDNKNYFLHIMMAITKQKLYFEKQLKMMNEQIETLVLSQNALLETNRKLASDIDYLKLQKNSL